MADEARDTTGITEYQTLVTGMELRIYFKLSTKENGIRQPAEGHLVL